MAATKTVPKTEAKKEPNDVTLLSKESKIGDIVRFNKKGVSYKGEIIDLVGPGAIILMSDSSTMAVKVG